MTNARAELTVFGQVQRVGYRNIVAMAAFKHSLTGAVWNDEKNEPAVHVIAEGEKQQLDYFVKEIKIREFPVFVEKIEEKYEPPKNEFTSFERKLGLNPQKETLERADEGALYMMLLAKETRDFRKESKTSFEILTKETTEFRRESNANFSTMDKKYGAIREELEDFKKVTKELTQTLKEDRESLKKITQTIVELVRK